jgi:hypothetical protein
MRMALSTLGNIYLRTSALIANITLPLTMNDRNTAMAQLSISRRKLDKPTVQKRPETTSLVKSNSLVIPLNVLQRLQHRPLIFRTTRLPFLVPVRRSRR